MSLVNFQQTMYLILLRLFTFNFLTTHFSQPIYCIEFGSFEIDIVRFYSDYMNFFDFCHNENV